MILDYKLFSIIPHYLSVLGSLVIVGSILYQFIIIILKIYNAFDCNSDFSIIIIQFEGRISDNHNP